MHKYLAFIWSHNESNAVAQTLSAVTHLAVESRWEVAHQSSGLLVIHKPDPPSRTYGLSHNRGVVLGTLYHRKDPRETGDLSVTLDAVSSERIRKSGGRHLVERYWGTYVAFFHQPETDACSVLRDPTANLACFRIKWGNINIFFSDIEDLTSFTHIPLSVNWKHITARLFLGFHLSRDCALEGIEDIPGGECLTVVGEDLRRTTLWHPAQFCANDLIEDEQTAALELRSVVLHVVRALASHYSNILVLLSGGLDSSIVTSCLAQENGERRVTCLNFYFTNDTGGPKNQHFPGFNRENMAKVRRVIGSADERVFANSVANTCGFQMIERELKPEDLDCTRVRNALLSPRPSTYVFVLSIDDLQCESVAATKAAACFTGIGGDTVFYCTLRAIGALDYAYLHPFGSRLLRNIGTTAVLSGESYMRVFGKVIKHGFMGSPLPPLSDPMAQPHFLCAEAAGAVDPRYFHHPWAETSLRLTPGKHAHMQGFADSVLSYPHGYYRERIAPSVTPLVSQPVVETCLRIPTYVLLADGVSRGLARRAFRDLLPPAVAKRTTKGVAIAFWQRIVRHNMSFIRECLLDGILANRHLLDRAKLEEYLNPEQPFLTVQPQQIMDYLACEAWLAQWKTSAL